MNPGTLPWLKRMMVEGDLFGIAHRLRAPAGPMRSEPSAPIPESEPEPDAIDTEGVPIETEKERAPCR